MTFELGVVLALLAAAIVMFAIDRPRMDAVALMMLTALPFTGAVTMSEALAGFSNNSVVLIAAMFVIGNGLVRTGVAQQLGDWLITQAGTSETRLIVLLMVVVCGLGATMSSTAVTAIFIPIALRIAQGTGIPPGRLMMPLCFAALISGMMTLVATPPNMIINAELVQYLRQHGEPDARGFHFFSFLPVGAPVLALGVAYMLVARRWLPTQSVKEGGRPARRPRLADWIALYHLEEREHRVRILPGSPFAGRTLEVLRLREVADASVVSIERNGTVIQPTPKTTLQTGDVLLIDFPTPDADAGELRRNYGLATLPLSGAYFADHSQEVGMAEVLLPADSKLIGKSVADADLRTRTSLSVIGLRRGTEAVLSHVAHEELKVGDTLLVIGPWKAIQNAQSSGEQFVVLNVPAELEEVLQAPGKAFRAVLCLLLVVGLMISGVVPNVQAALIGCLLMGGLGCVTLQSAYRSIEWKTILLIVGMMPFSIALERTGGIEMASEALKVMTSGAGAHGILAALFFITVVMGMFISNTATAVLMAPMAIATADKLGASPFPFAMIVALAASTSFMTPVSSPVNTLVVTPGNYTFADFVRIGLPFSIVVAVVCIVLVPWLLPLSP